MIDSKNEDKNETELGMINVIYITCLKMLTPGLTFLLYAHN